MKKYSVTWEDTDGVLHTEEMYFDELSNHIFYKGFETIQSIILIEDEK